MKNHIIIFLSIQFIFHPVLFSQGISTKLEISPNLSITKLQEAYATNTSNKVGFDVLFSGEREFNRIAVIIGIGFSNKRLNFDGYYFAPNHSNGSYDGNFDYNHHISSYELLVPINLNYALINNDKLKIYSSFGFELKSLIGNNTNISSISNNSLDWSGKTDLRYWDNISGKFGYNGRIGIGIENKNSDKRVSPFLEFRCRIIGNKLIYHGNSSINSATNDVIINNPNIMLTFGLRLKEK